MYDSSASPLRGDRLLKLRNDKQLTQSDVALALDCAISTVSQMENGSRGSGCSLDMLVSLCGFYTCSANYLLGLSEHTHKPQPAAWRDDFNERQLGEIALDVHYSEKPFGTDGHNARLIIAMMAKLLDM